MSSKQIKNLRSNLETLLQKIKDAKLIRSSTYRKLENNIASYQKKKLVDLTSDLTLLYDVKSKFSVSSLKSTVETIRNNIFMDALPKNDPKDFKKKDISVKKITMEILEEKRPESNATVTDTVVIGDEQVELVLIKKDVVLTAFSRFVKNLHQGDIIEKDEPNFSTIFQRAVMNFNRENESISYTLQNLNSVPYFIKIVSIENTIKPVKPTKVENQILRKSNTMKMMTNKYISYKYNPNAKGFKNLILYKPNVENMKENSCLFTAFLDYFGESIKKLVPKQYKKVPTYETLYKICFPEAEEVPAELPCSIKQFAPVLDYYKIKMVVYTEEQNTPVFTFVPEKLNSDMKNVWPVFVKNEHIYNLNNELPSLYRKDTKKCENEDLKELTVSQKYHISTKTKMYKYIEDLDELCSINWNEVKEDSVEIAINKNLNDLYFHIRNRYFIEPTVSAYNSQITRIGLLINKKTVNIYNPGYNKDDRDITFDNAKYFQTYNELESRFINNVLTNNNLSTYHPNLIDNLKLLAPKAIKGQWNAIQDKENDIGEIDINKAYLSAFLQMDFFPVFTMFDKFQPYNGQDIHDYGFYIVETISALPSKAHSIVFTNKDVNLIVGMNLKQFKDQTFFKIIGFAQPQILQPNNNKEIIQDIWNSQLSTEHKKFIPNKVFGLMEKLANKAQLTKIFSNLDEASRYHQENKLTTNIDRINGSFTLPNKTVKTIVRNGDETEVNTITHKGRPVKSTIFMTKQHKEANLVTGFYPIKVVIYSIIRQLLFKLTQKYERKYNIVGMNTDAIYIEVNDNVKFIESFQKVNTIKNTFEGIGKIKGAIVHKHLPTNEIQSESLKEKVSFIESIKTEPITLKHEEDFTKKEYQQEFNTILNQTKKLIVEASVPGAGKTTLFKNYIKQNGFKSDEYAIITPYNVLAFENVSDGFTSETFHKFFGISIENKQHEMKEGAYDNIKLIVFDEIYAYSFESVCFIYDFVMNHPNIIFGATGDANQNKPIDNITQAIMTSGSNTKQYYNDIFSDIFLNKVSLNISKRLKTEEDRQKLNQIKDLILNKKMGIRDICFKFFKPIKTINKDHKHIAYLNETVKKVGKEIHQQNVNALNSRIKVKSINNETYYINQEITCRNGALRINNQRLYTNYVYKIKEFGSETTVIADISEKTTVILPNSQLNQNNFYFSGAATGHSCQGLTYDKPVVVHDIGFHHMTPEWFWTAITRTTELKNVYFMQGKNDESVKTTIIKRIHDHKMQDIKANRKITSDYVTPEWVENLISQSNQCPRCQGLMNITENNMHTFSIDRIDNDLAHVKSNCMLICRHCNVSKH